MTLKGADRTAFPTDVAYQWNSGAPQPEPTEPQKARRQKGKAKLQQKAKREREETGIKPTKGP